MRPPASISPSAGGTYHYLCISYHNKKTMKKQRIRRLRLITIVTVVPLSAATIISAFSPPSSSSLLVTNQRKISTVPHLQSTSSNSQDASSDEELTIEGYSRCLSPWEAKRSVNNESRQYSIIDRKPKWQKPLSVITKGVKKVMTKKVKPGSLILLRCGESKWTKTGRFTGWGEYIISLFIMSILCTNACVHA